MRSALRRDGENFGAAATKLSVTTLARAIQLATRDHPEGAGTPCYRDGTMKITVCGSITFYPEIERLKQDLETRGHEVTIPLLNKVVPKYSDDRKINFAKYIEEHGGIDAFPPDDPIWTAKQDALNDHFRKIEWADAILVANHEKRGVDGYIGGNTFIEIGLAFYLKKKIYILNPISSEIAYKQEIYGMKPILLNGDIDLVKS